MSNTDLITLAVVDDNRLVREGLVALLNRELGFQETAYANTESAIVAEARPRVLLLDVSLAGEDMLRVARAIGNRRPSKASSSWDLIPVRKRSSSVNAGVSGIVMKDASFDDFVATVRAVAAGDKVLPARLTESLFAQIANGSATKRSLKTSTSRATP